MGSDNASEVSGRRSRRAVEITVGVICLALALPAFLMGTPSGFENFRSWSLAVVLAGGIGSFFATTGHRLVVGRGSIAGRLLSPTLWIATAVLFLLVGVLWSVLLWQLPYSAYNKVFGELRLFWDVTFLGGWYWISVHLSRKGLSFLS